MSLDRAGRVRGRSAPDFAIFVVLSPKKSFQFFVRHGREDSKAYHVRHNVDPLFPAKSQRAALTARWTSVSWLERRRRMGSSVSRPTGRKGGYNQRGKWRTGEKLGRRPIFESRIGKGSDKDARFA
jgi:hypothetical protein